MRLIIFIALLSFLFSCDNNPSAETTLPPETKPVSNTSSRSSFDPDRKLESPDIKVQVIGLAQGGKVSLIGIYTDQFYKVDSTLVGANGNIHFKKNEPYQPGFIYLMLPDNQTTLQLLVDEDQTFSMKTNMNNLINGMEVEGSVDNQLLYQTLQFEGRQKAQFADIKNRLNSAKKGTPEYDQLKAEEKKLMDERAAYLEKVFTENANTFYTSFKRAGQNPDVAPIKNADGSVDNERFMEAYRSRFWEGVDFDDVRLLYTPVISNKLKRYMNELTAQNPDAIKASASRLVDQVLDKPEFYKFFANWVTLNYEPGKSTVMDAEAIFVHMIQNYFTYDRAFWSDSVEVHGLQLRAYEMSNSLLGQKGPDIKAKDMNGQMRTIFEMKSKYIIVYMWNPDCEHCAEETPQLVRFYQQWKSRGVDVYGISVNTEDADYRRAVKQYGMPWFNVFDPTNKSIYATYFVDNTPEIYVLDPDRTIIGKNLKVDQLQVVLERDMKKRGLM